MKKPCLEQRVCRRNPGVRCPDFLPPLLWSVSSHKGSERCGHRTRNQQRHSRGLRASTCESWSLRSHTDPSCEVEGPTMDCECRLRVCVPHGNHGPLDQKGECRRHLSPSLVSQNLERIFHPPPRPPPSTWLMLQSNLKTLNNKFDVNFQD